MMVGGHDVRSDLIRKYYVPRFFVPNAIFMSLHGPAITCIPVVASISQIHVPPIQHELKHCRVHI